MKMNLKELDLKRLLMEKGERFALWSCVGLMCLLIVLGIFVTGFGAGSADGNTKQLVDGAKQARQAMTNSRPTAGLDKIDPELDKSVEHPEIGPEVFAASRPWWLGGIDKDDAMRLPSVLEPVAFQIDYVRAQVPVVILNADGTKYTVLQAPPKPKGEAPKPANPMPPRMPPGFGRPPQGGAPFPGMRPQPGGQPAPTQFGADGQPIEIAKDREAKFVPISDEVKDGDIARTILPTRLAIISAEFPYAAQVDQFKTKLKKTFEELVRDGDIAFPEAAIEVQRRTLKPDGNVKTDWQDIAVLKNLDHLRSYYVNVKQRAPENPDLFAYGIIWTHDPLVMPRPPLFREDDKYPELKLAGIDETIAQLQKAYKGEAPPPPAQSTSRLGENSIFDTTDDDPKQPGDPTKRPTKLPGANTPPTPPPGGSRDGGTPKNTLKSERILPEKCLLRVVDILDASAPAGTSYEYRIRVVMENPLSSKINEGKAISVEMTHDKLIRAEKFTPVPGRVTIPQETFFYVVDERPVVGKIPLVWKKWFPDRFADADKDRLALQVHRWLDDIAINPENQESKYPVGEWSILERVLTYRGEYIGRYDNVEVPIWWPTKEQFIFVSAPHKADRNPNNYKPGIPVNFNTNAVLVDFQGGRQKYKIADRPPSYDEGPYEALVLLPDGRLITRTSRTDTEDSDRKDRSKAWHAWLDSVRDQLVKKVDPKDNPLFKDTPKR